jgi:hypothetical protein
MRLPSAPKSSAFLALKLIVIVSALRIPSSDRSSTMTLSPEASVP